MSDPSATAESKDPRIDSALREYLERLDRGETLDREKFIAQHSEIGEELRSFIAAEEQLRKLAGAERIEERVEDSTQSFALHGLETIAPQAGTKRSAESDTGGLTGEFGRYRIVRALGKGAMGTVYLAEDTQLQRQVALKTPHFEQQPTPELLERFYREARAAATLRHANICPVFDVGQIEGTHYISMAYIEGNPLSAFIRSSKPQPERQILIVVRKLAQALQDAHDHGTVHRDLKPANIMVDKRNEPIIMDFGLARQLQRDQNIRITQSGMLIGTPAYMSPEQIDGEPDTVGPPSDQYSLGVILYELLTGQLPFRGSLTAVMAQIITKEATPPSQLRPGLDPRIEAACLKMMAKSPADRFASLSAAAAELATILKNPGVHPTSTGKSAAAFTLPASAEGPAARAAGASQILKSQKQKTLTGSDLTSLEELARKCLARRDYDQVIQIIERIPEEKRSAGIAALLEKSRAKADEIAFLICEIDEAVRFNDRGTALKKAGELLKIKPGHHRALKVQEQFAGYGEGGAARIGPLRQFTQPWNEGGWIPWSVLAFGLTIFGGLSAIVLIYINGTAVEVDIKDPGIAVTVKGKEITITGPKDERIAVEPGEQQLKITYAGLETVTTSFSVKKGEKQLVTVSIVDGRLLAKLSQEITPLALIPEKDKATNKGAAAEGPDNAGRKTPAAAGSASKTIATAAVIQLPLLAAPFDQNQAANARQAWAQAQQVPAELKNSAGIDLVLIPAGQFAMGSPETADELLKVFPKQAQKSWMDGERPVHRVTIGRPFYLGKYETTLAQFRKFVEKTGYKTEFETGWKGGTGLTAKGEHKQQQNFNWRDWGVVQTDDCPVVNVTHKDAAEFCKWLSTKEGRLYRLPTEAEWEYACRAGSTTRFYNGDDPQALSKIANFGKKSAKDGRYTFPVGQFAPNNFGLYDMSGNVSEWCADWWGVDYYAVASVTDPEGPEHGKDHVSRGGGWSNPAIFSRSAHRRHFGPGGGNCNIGFRVACATAVGLSTATSNEAGPATTAPVKTENTPSTPAFVPLFNGRDLAGWKTHPSQPGRWRVENGVLIGSGTPTSHLYSDRSDFTDFDLRVEARINKGGNSGVDFRTQFGPGWPANDPKFPLGYEAQIDSTNHAAKTGSLFVVSGLAGSGSAVVALHESPVPAGQWFTLEVIARASHITIKVDGVETANDDDSRFTSGHIALQQHEPQTVVEFRKIEIKELEARKTAVVVRSHADKDLLIAPFDESEARKAQEKWSDRLKTPVDWTNKIEMKLILIPPGEFQMGDLNADRHAVRITRPFYLGAYEVTRGQFAKFVAAEHFKTQAERDKGGVRLENSDRHFKSDAKHQYTWRHPGFPQEDTHPVVDVSWDDAREFCDWLSRKEGTSYRLPTEAEWEYACRAGTTTRTYNGDDENSLTTIGNIADATARKQFSVWAAVKSSDAWVYTSPVGLFRPNHFGLHDTIGNVNEWCSDWYGKDYYKTSPQSDPPGPSAGEFRVGRGGSYLGIPVAFYRWKYSPWLHLPDWGFRVVCEIAPSSSAAKTAPSENSAPEVFADFESGSYGRWKKTGTAFGPLPARGALRKQQTVSGYGGQGLVNSFFGGDRAVGTLTSPQFTIRRTYIQFRIGGGRCPGKACINLLSGGKVVRTATGANDERLMWSFWDVSDLRGQTAQIEIVDKETGGWGHINIDDIRFANEPPAGVEHPQSDH
jgi:formylglycine-generating enzyme required for sulfatase activity/serine/threonine protein kinase